MSAHRKTIYEALGRDPVHPFPARMAPGIALDVLESSSTQLKVLDPMMGSGTVIAMARAGGHSAIGVDIDPLAVLIASVWTKTCDVQEIRERAAKVLERARQRFSETLSRDAYPPGADQETKRFIRYWFDDYSRCQLYALSETIRRVRDENSRRVLWCAFSRLIIAKQAGASLAMDLSHSRPHKTYEYAPAKPFNNFLIAVDKVLNNCLDKTKKNHGPAPDIKLGDARCLPVKSGTVDLVLTSPPYLNAIDYIRCSKFSLVWMGHSVDELRGVRSNSVGTEIGKDPMEDPQTLNIIKDLRMKPALNSRGLSILARYIHDMSSSVSEVERVLVSKGRAIYVVGENTIRGTYIRNSKIISLIAEASGLTLKSSRVRELPHNRRYLPPPTASKNAIQLNARMRQEVILSFSK